MGRGANILLYGTPAFAWGVVAPRPVIMGGWYISNIYRGVVHLRALPNAFVLFCATDAACPNALVFNCMLLVCFKARLYLFGYRFCFNVSLLFF